MIFISKKKNVTIKKHIKVAIDTHNNFNAV